jgi:hypothetical protein
MLSMIKPNLTDTFTPFGFYLFFYNLRLLSLGLFKGKDVKGKCYHFGQINKPYFLPPSLL